jgi:hypothetical protein
MLIGAEGDQAVLPSSVARAYIRFGPKASGGISGEGHNTYRHTRRHPAGWGASSHYAVSNHFTTPNWPVGHQQMRSQGLLPPQGVLAGHLLPTFRSRRVLLHGSATSS